ncbi:hypothetical protein HMPREF2811_06270 [Globicatella sp. HMSC072A10]|nr:hypothetical protein HMPREF2811_06270 [Globicatella sp. HMSC072A10]
MGVTIITSDYCYVRPTIAEPLGESRVDDGPSAYQEQAMRRIGALRGLMRRMGIVPSDFQDKVEERAVGLPRQGYPTHEELM